MDSKGDFIWSDGTLVVGQSWADGQPDGKDGSDCIVHTPSVSEYTWYDADCNLKAWSICEFVRP